MTTEVSGYVVASIGKIAEKFSSHGIKCSITRAINGHTQVEVSSTEMRECHFCPAYLLSRLNSIAETWDALLWIESDQETGYLTAYIS